LAEVLLRNIFAGVALGVAVMDKLFDGMPGRLSRHRSSPFMDGFFYDERNAAKYACKYLDHSGQASLRSWSYLGPSLPRHISVYEISDWKSAREKLGHHPRTEADHAGRLRSNN
jgi:hypothetical protein